MTFVTVRDGCSFDERQSEVRGLPPKPGRLRAESRGSRSCQTAAADRRSAISRAISDCSALRGRAWQAGTERYPQIQYVSDT
jgi:hypothetical protein